MVHRGAEEYVFPPYSQIDRPVPLKTSANWEYGLIRRALQYVREFCVAVVSVNWLHLSYSLPQNVVGRNIRLQKSGQRCKRVVKTIDNSCHNCIGRKRFLDIETRVLRSIE